MEEAFTPSWIACLDESMLHWASEFTCPGFVFVPRKPWPFGDECHTICCALCGMLFGVEMCEGKDSLPQCGKPEHEDRGGKTVGSLLRLANSIWGTGRAIALDSGFCVLQGIIDIGDVDVIKGTLDNIPYHVCGVKEPDCIMMLMTTCGTLE